MQFHFFRNCNERRSKWRFKVFIKRLVHFGFEKSSSTFWQVRYCVHRTWRFCQKYDEDFLNFVAFSENPNFLWFVWRKTFEESLTLAIRFLLCGLHRQLGQLHTIVKSIGTLTIWWNSFWRNILILLHFCFQEVLMKHLYFCNIQ